MPPRREIFQVEINQSEVIALLTDVEFPLLPSTVEVTIMEAKNIYEPVSSSGGVVLRG